MKLIFYISFISGLVFYGHLSYAQSNDVNFTLAVLPPRVSGDLNPVQIEKLESKLIQVINNSNQAVEGYYNDFVLYSSFTVDESSTVEGGLQNITVTTFDLSLFIKQISSNVIFNTFSTKLKGSGSNREESITNAINNLNVSDNKYSRFIADAKEKILKYYYNNCNDIIQKASDLGVKHDYEPAISMLESIPSSSSCYDEAKKKSIYLYKKYQNANCSKNISIARSEIAVKNYEDAMETLKLIDPESHCWSDANKLIEQISDKVSKKDKQEYNLDVMLINAVKEVAKNYYSKKLKSKKD